MVTPKMPELCYSLMATGDVPSQVAGLFRWCTHNKLRQDTQPGVPTTNPLPPFNHHHADESITTTAATTISSITTTITPLLSALVSRNTAAAPARRYVHRVGRSARMGASGEAVMLLLPHEVPYVNLLRSKGVLLEREAAEGLSRHLPTPLGEPHARRAALHRGVAPAHTASGLRQQALARPVPGRDRRVTGA